VAAVSLRGNESATWKSDPEANFHAVDVVLRARIEIICRMQGQLPDQGGKQSDPVSLPIHWVFLVIGIILCAFSFFWDDTVVAWVQVHDLKGVTRIAGYISNCGNWPELMVLGCVGLGIALWTKNRKLRRIVICMMIASTIAGAAVNSMKILSGRARPNNTEARREWNGLRHDGQFLLFKNKYHSFPSGHTGSAFAFFGVVAFARRSCGWLFLIAAGVIGWSRIQVNAHHLSDVLTGMVVGITVAYLTWWWIQPWLARKFHHS